MTTDMRCPECKKTIPLSQDRELWMKMGEERLLRKINELVASSKPTKSEEKK